MLKVFLFAAMAIVLCPAIGSAELVSNVIDDFSSAGPNLGNNISRTQSAGATLIPNLGFGFSFPGPAISSITYTAGTSTFAGIDSDFANGVSFAASFTFAPANTFIIRAYGGNGVDPDAEVAGTARFLATGFDTPVTFSNDFSSYKTLRFTVESSGSGFAALGGSLTAVPEPTSLALFGAAVAGIGFRRRRR